MTDFLRKIGRDAVRALKARVAAELATTFRSRYAGELTFAEVLQPEHITRYSQQGTGGKFVILPNGR